MMMTMMMMNGGCGGGGGGVVFKHVLVQGFIVGLISLLMPPHPQSGGASSHDGWERGYHGNHGPFSTASLAGIDCIPGLRQREREEHETNFSLHGQQCPVASYGGDDYFISRLV